MLLRKSLIDRFGLWDEDYPGYFVDTDWCFRLNRAGVKVYCLPAAKIVHHEQNSRTRKRSPSRIWMFHMGALRFYRKNLSLGRADPRTLLACLALSLRAGILIVLNAFKESAPVTAQSEGAAVVSPEFLDKR
jgi:GT2 family glycosyltransferase